jgi:hypothetical protein
MTVHTHVRACLLQVLLAYPNAVGCASVSAVKQETEAVLQVRTDSGCNGVSIGSTVTLTSDERAPQLHTTPAAAACSCSLKVPQLP